MTKPLPRSSIHPIGKVAMVSVLARDLPVRASASRFEWGVAALCARGAKSTMAGIFGAAAPLCCLLLAPAPGHAQSPPPDPASAAAPSTLTVLLPPDEINRIVRAAGFSPL